VVTPAVSRQRRELWAGVDYRRRSSELYGLLIKPVEKLLDKDAEICISDRDIPDEKKSIENYNIGLRETKR